MDATATNVRRLGLTERQQAIRATGIGASEIAAVAGLHPTIRPVDVYLQKVGEAAPFDGNAFTEWGHRLERAVAEAWQDRHPDSDIFTPGTLRHRDERFPFALASPDRIVVPRGRRAREVWSSLLEIKNVSTYQAGAFGGGGDEVPEHFLVQVQWQLEVADLEAAELVPLIGGHDYREYPIRRDRELGAMLLDVAGRFWIDHVEARVPPPVDGSASYGAFLRRRFARETGDLLEPSDAAREIVARLRSAKAAKKAAEEAEALAENELKALIGEAPGVAGLCTWKSNASGGTDWKGLATSLNPTPEQLAAFARPGARVLRLSKEK